ncbi:MAG: hypothetical protein AAFZ52_02795 [Bacteroidota bacterium]
MQTHALPVLLCTLALMACQPQEEPADTPPPAMEEALLGTWETIEIEVKAPSYQGQDTSIHHHIREADWGRTYGVQPARTVFTPDGKLARTHKLLNGQVADVTHGLWKVQGSDSLLFIEPNKTLYYAHDLAGNRLTLTGRIDWDLDGEEDDDFRSVLRLVGRTE